jgi:hypothetical protein
MQYTQEFEQQKQKRLAEVEGRQSKVCACSACVAVANV